MHKRGKSPANYSKLASETIKLASNLKYQSPSPQNHVLFRLSIDKEYGVKTWNSCTENELHGISGFKKCLRHTLYRPRDVIALLNNGMAHAQKQSRHTLTEDDIKNSAAAISKSRLDDLTKEYESVYPGLNRILKRFSDASLKTSPNNIDIFFENALKEPELTNIENQHLSILLNEKYANVFSLYSIGFLGIRDENSKTYIFCHDGRQPKKIITEDTELIVHPCYWPAIGGMSLAEDDNLNEEIFDEYEITIYSSDADQRSQIIGRLITDLHSIQAGSDDAAKFEKWCLNAISYCFSYQLDNITLHPNKNTTQLRDLVATNKGQDGVWKRIIEDYATRQIIFEIKNFEELDIEHYRQVHAYLGKEYGRLAFIITRSKSIEPNLSESRAFREFYKNEHSKFIIKINANWIVSALSKLRSPQKFDFADKQLSKLLDDYIRVHANEQIVRKKKS